MPKKVLINLLNFRPGQIGGAETYVRKVVSNLQTAGGDIEYQLLLTKHGDVGWEGLELEKHLLDTSDILLKVKRFLEATSFYRANSIARKIKSISPDLVWYPQQSIFPKSPRYKSILTTVDFQHLRFPRNFSVAERCFRNRIYPWSLHNTDLIISISQQTKDEITYHYGIEAEKIRVIHLGYEGTDFELEPIDSLNGSEFFYCPAATYPHKNHEALVRSVAALAEQGKWKGKIVLTGEKTALWHSHKNLMRELGVSSLFEHLGFLPFGQAQWLMSKAKCVLFPSLYEGFGMPIIEAARFNTPLLASDLPIYDELGLPQENRIDFSDATSLINALETVKSPKLSVVPKDWTQVAGEHEALFRELLA